MKLTYAQLEAQITKALLPVYIINGDEWLLKQDTLNLIRKRAKQLGFNERIKIAAEDKDEDSLYTALYSSSLLADKQIVELDLRQAAPNKAMGEILQTYSQNPSPHHLLLIDVGKSDDKISRAAWYKALEKIGGLVMLWPLSREQLPQWITQRARKYKLSLTPQALHLLADFAEGNLAAAAQALEKLYLYPNSAETAIDVELVKTILTDESRYSIFDFVETLIGCEPARALHMLQTLKLAGTELTLLLWAITRELRLLADLADQVKAGYSIESLCQKYRIYFRRQTSVRKFLSRFNAQDCLRFLASAAEIDLVIKGAVAGNSWEKIADYCLAFRFQ